MDLKQASEVIWKPGDAGIKSSNPGLLRLIVFAVRRSNKSAIDPIHIRYKISSMDDI